MAHMKAEWAALKEGPNSQVFQLNRAEFHLAASEIGILLDEAQLDAFEAFEQALYAANEVMNLTRIPIEDAWRRHFLDSLLFQNLIPAGSSVLDLGTGPGFPAWPLACARPDLQVTALDSNGKMLGFLAGQPLPNLEIVNARAEEWGVRERYDVVTGRALAPVSIQLELSAAACKIGGAVIPMRTVADRDSIKAFPDTKLGLSLRGMNERALVGTEALRLFPVFKKFAPTPREYPRRWAEIKSKPIS
jgi:16S rRNA (guanine527-N7)-methyltransferase